MKNQNQAEIVVSSNSNENHANAASIYLFHLEPFARDVEVVAAAQDGQDSDQTIINTSNIPMKNYHANPSTDPTTWSVELQQLYLRRQHVYPVVAV
jgi:hypothetical protein